MAWREQQHRQEPLLPPPPGGGRVEVGAPAPPPGSAPALALEVRGLTGPAEQPVIHDIALRVPRGATQLVLGPIHSGKSVLMRHLVGLERAARGTLLVGGQEFDLAAATGLDLRRMRSMFGVVFEGSALLGRLTVLENVELPLLEHSDATAAEAREAARRLLSEVGLDELHNDELTPAQLTRLDRRRVALARALALRPPVVLLDEPTLGLDSHSAAELDDKIARAQEAGGFAVLIFSNEVRHAFGRARHIYVMEHGRVVAEGTLDALMQSEHDLVHRLLHRRGRR